MTLSLWVLWSGIALGLLIAHEGGHLGMTWALGGRITGVHFRGWAVGIGVDLTTIFPQQKAWTIAAGLLAETLVAIVGWGIHPSWAWMVCWATSVLVNGIPWWSQNDGSRWLALRKAPHI